MSLGLEDQLVGPPLTVAVSFVRNYFRKTSPILSEIFDVRARVSGVPTIPRLQTLRVAALASVLH